MSCLLTLMPLYHQTLYSRPSNLWRNTAGVECWGQASLSLVEEDGALKSCCCYFPTPWNVALKMTRLDRFFPNTRLANDMSWDHASVRACDWVPGCYYMVRREILIVLSTRG